MELKATDVVVRLSRKDIVKQASLQVKGRQFVGLLGPNGSGKTTLLKSVYRVLKPASGIITLDDTDITRLPHRESAKRMGVVSQFTNMSFDFSVEEVVLMGRAPHKKALSRDTTEDFQIVEDSLRRVNMLEFRDRSFLTLSGGEKQRVALARALVNEPKLIIADEPTGNLDSKTTKEVMEMIRKFARTFHQTIVLVSHDPEMTEYADRIVTLVDGEIISDVKTENYCKGETG